MAASGGTASSAAPCSPARGLARARPSARLERRSSPPTLPRPHPRPQAGVNIWRALRDVRDVHPAWRHVAHKPITEADLPRPINDPSSRMHTVPAGDIAAAVKASFGADFKHAVAAEPAH